MTNVIRLSNERAWRTYLGGTMIDKLHSVKSSGDNHFPEEWIMSITSCRNVGREDIKDEGLSKELKTGRYLVDMIKENPIEMLGANHYNMFGATTGVLIKLIDAAERLSIQVHPNKQKARKYFNSDYGKTESWHILGGRTVSGEKPCIYLGFKENISKDYWKAVFEEQNIEKMLDCLNKIYVNKGDTFLIKGGVPHAIGAGCFLIEVQEPTDYTIRTERTTVSGFKIADEMCHQGIGFDNMFDCFEYDGMSESDVAKKYKLVPQKTENGLKLVSYSDTNCFSLEKIYVNDSLTMKAENVFYGLYILGGSGNLICNSKVEKLEVGQQYFVPPLCEMVFEAETKLEIAKFYGPCCK